MWKRFVSFFSIMTSLVEANPFQEIPKAELHLHLGGSYPLEYVQSLATPEQKELLDTQLKLIAGGVDYHEGFSIFSLIEKIVNTEEKIENGTAALCRSLKEDGVIYAEIRTGIKNLGKGREHYLLSVLQGIEQELSDEFHARLLLSLRRNSPLEYAKETVDLALKYRHRGIVGIDISGISTVGEIELLLPELLRAKESGLFLTLHIGEHPLETKQLQVLQTLQPHRIGHGVHLEPEALEWMLENKIPLEVCLTSSMCVKMIEKDALHPGLDYHFRQHPIAICTDDPLIFSTSLSQELDLFHKATALPIEKVEELARSSLDHAFLSDEERAHLESLFLRKKVSRADKGV